MIGYIWARQSNKYDKAVYSIESQLDACREAARKDGVEVTPDREFVVKFSGVDLWKIPQLGELRQVIERTPGQKRVYCYAQDRLVRGEEGPEIFWLVYELKRHGADIRIILDPVDFSDFAGQIITLFKGHKAASEPNDIKDRTMRGKIKRVQEGKIWNHSLDKFGYTRIREEGRAVFNEEEKAILLRIIQRIFNGESLGSICRRLTINKIPTPRQRRGVVGKKPLSGIWRPSTITSILRDPAYKGEGAAMRYKNGSKGKTPESEWIKIPDAYPPMLTPEQWDDLQIKLSEVADKKSRARNERHPLVFRGHLICGRCGQRMSVGCQPYTVQSGEVRRSWYYACKRRDGAGKLICQPWNQLSTREVEQKGWEKVKERFQPEAIEKLTATTDTRPNVANLNARRRALVESQANKEAQRQNLITRLSEAGDATAKAILSRLDEIGAEITSLSKQIRQTDYEISTVQHRVREMESILLELGKLGPSLQDADFARKRGIVESFNMSLLWNPATGELTIDSPVLNTIKGDYILSDSSSSRALRKHLIGQIS